MNSNEELYPTTIKDQNSAVFKYTIKGQGLEITTRDDFRTYRIHRRKDNLLVVNYNQRHFFTDTNLFRACDTNNFVMIGYVSLPTNYRRNVMIVEKNTLRSYQSPQTDSDLNFIEITKNTVLVYDGILVFDDLIYRIDNMYVNNYKLDNDSVITICRLRDKTSMLIYYNLITSESLKLCIGNNEINFDAYSKQLTVNSSPVNIQHLIDNKRKENTIYQSYKEDGVEKMFKIN